LANHKSAEKRARQSIKRESRNVQVKSAVKTAESKLEKAIAAKSKDTKALLSAFTAAVMSASSKGVYKKETASRKVGRLSARASALTK
jgi:small subunit ribosomal protein S20